MGGWGLGSVGRSSYFTRQREAIDPQIACQAKVYMSGCSQKTVPLGRSSPHKLDIVHDGLLNLSR